ncbi:MAG TPA: 16S rRNA (cytidine(1402)-2'-O)-methyltransferase [Candidatus Polarisedimenticolaceae bacterium]
MSGTLHVVATPIGNLDDLSPRAVETLRRCAKVACEDTRRTGGLLARFGVETPMLSLHKFNEAERIEAILGLLAEGREVALVSDGGTPGISDPGAWLVRAAIEAGHRVSPVPGPSAVAALLSAAGLPADRYVFDGFLPPREGERRRRLRELRAETRTVVVFEAPHRLRDALRDVAEVFGGRTIVLGRELTKIHETILRASASELLARLGDGDILGEVVLAIAGHEVLGDGPSGEDESAARIRAVWSAACAATADRRASLKAAAKELGLKRAELQRRLAELGER